MKLTLLTLIGFFILTRLAWNPNPVNQNVDHYRVSAYTNEQCCLFMCHIRKHVDTITTTRTEVAVNMKSGQWYEFRVAAHNDAGYSDNATLEHQAQ